MAGTYEEHVALTSGDSLLSLGRLEVIAEDVLAGLEPGHSAETGDVEQDASPDQAVCEHLDRIDRRASGSHGVVRRAVVQESLVGDMAERVDVACGRRGESAPTKSMAKCSGPDSLSSCSSVVM